MRTVVSTPPSPKRSSAVAAASFLHVRPSVGVGGLHSSALPQKTLVVLEPENARRRRRLLRPFLLLTPLAYAPPPPPCGRAGGGLCRFFCVASGAVGCVPYSGLEVEASAALAFGVGAAAPLPPPHFPRVAAASLVRVRARPPSFSPVSWCYFGRGRSVGRPEEGGREEGPFSLSAPPSPSPCIGGDFLGRPLPPLYFPLLLFLPERKRIKCSSPSPFSRAPRPPPPSPPPPPPLLKLCPRRIKRDKKGGKKERKGG